MQCNRLGNPDGRAAADGNDAVGFRLADRLQAGFGNRFWNVNDGLRMQARRAVAEDVADSLAQPFAAAGRRDHKGTADLEPLNFFADARQCA